MVGRQIKCPDCGHDYMEMAGQSTHLDRTLECMLAFESRCECGCRYPYPYTMYGIEMLEYAAYASMIFSLGWYLVMGDFIISAIVLLIALYLVFIASVKRRK